MSETFASDYNVMRKVHALPDLVEAIGDLEERLKDPKSMGSCQRVTAMTGSNTPNTVPRSITPALLQFCASIASTIPGFIPSVPIRRAVTSFCFENVAQKVRVNGGSIAYGWAIWHLPDLYFEAEHHAVWRNKFGNLIDVSPQMGGPKRLLFLLDESAIYDPFAFRPNLMATDGNSKRARQMVKLGNRRHALLNRCRVPGTPEIRLYEHDQLELAEIDWQIRETMAG